MSPTPALSVVMPTYNSAAFVDESVESILRQTFSDFELILVDDGSTDDTHARSLRWAATDDRVIASRNERNRGACAARNVGIAVARAPWIACMDADDLCMPQRFERQMQHLEDHPHVDVLAAHSLIFFDDPQVCFVPRWRRGGLRGGTTPGSHATFVMRRSLFEAYGGYDGTFGISEEHELLTRFAHHGACIDKVREPLVKIRRHGGNATLQHKRAQTGQTLHVLLLSITRYRIGLTLRGYLVLLETIAQYAYLSVGLDRVIPRRVVHKVLRREPRAC